MKRITPLILFFNILVALLFSLSIKSQEAQKVELFFDTGHANSIASVAFSSDGNILASGGRDGAVILSDFISGSQIRSFYWTSYIEAVALSYNGKFLAAGRGGNGDVKIWNITTGQEIKLLEQYGSNPVLSLAFSPDDKFLAVVGETVISLWDTTSWEKINILQSRASNGFSVSFSPNNKMLATGGRYEASVIDLETKEILFRPSFLKTSRSVDFHPSGEILAVSSQGNVEIWNVSAKQLIHSISGSGIVKFSPDGRILARGTENGIITTFNVKDWEEINSFSTSPKLSSIQFHPQNLILASSNDKTIRFWNVKNGKEEKSISSQISLASKVRFSLTGKKMAVIYDFERILRVIDLNKTHIIDIKCAACSFDEISFSPDDKLLASSFYNADKAKNEARFWETITGQEITAPSNLPSWVKFREYSNDDKDYFDDFIAGTNIKANTDGPQGQVEFINKTNNNKLATIFVLNENDFVVTTPEGRFDTNKSLDNIKGFHWIVNNEISKPVPLDVFMRQYYEPNLLARILKCNEENNCDKEFKPLPSIAEINRVQPKVLIKDVKQVKDSADLVDVAVEVESVTEDVSVSAADRAKKEKKTSGVFDLRLFRDDQLVGVSASQGKLEKFIKDAPRLVEETRKSGKLIDTPEDRAWREANDVFALEAENVRIVSANKIEYVFRNVRLPKDGRESVEFKAYAFNADKVKSATTEPLKFSIPKAVSAEKKKGKAILVSIGVNASENPGYDLRYAANDAREMQKIVGGNLLKEKGAKYADVIQIPLVSDYKTEQFPAVNAAQKEIIKGVFALLAGKNYKDVLAEIGKINPKLAEEFQKIPNIEKLTQIEPEDTLIITYAGHGYADIAGIFYLLPSNIGKDTRQLTTENLRKMISSDELSLWMQDITAAEMIMIIDACHSSAAVQGDGFKPGPMASRGLGQLAYDKDMKILSATQADNVALELGSLQQGLLSYALLQDGIVLSLADTDKNKQLLSTEWLSFAEKRVPELYAEVKDGKRSVFINGEQVKDGKSRSEIIDLDGKQKSNLNLQQPTVFDFKRRKTVNNLFNLP